MLLSVQKKNNWPMNEKNGLFVLEAPGGYKYFIINESEINDKGKFIYLNDQIIRIILFCYSLIIFFIYYIYFNIQYCRSC